MSAMLNQNDSTTALMRLNVNLFAHRANGNVDTLNSYDLKKMKH